MPNPVLDLYLLVPSTYDDDLTGISASEWAWRYASSVNNKGIRIYRNLNTARGVRTRALRLKAKGRANVSVAGIRILHIVIDLATGSTTAEWVE